MLPIKQELGHQLLNVRLWHRQMGNGYLLCATLCTRSSYVPLHLIIIIRGRNNEPVLRGGI